MAIAKPIRALAFVSLMLCSFLFYQIYKSTTGPPKGPGDVITSYEGADPMGERMRKELWTIGHLLMTFSYGRTIRGIKTSDGRLCARSSWYSTHKCNSAGVGSQ